jgi:hypothetical protein
MDRSAYGCFRPSHMGRSCYTLRSDRQQPTARVASAGRCPFLLRLSSPSRPRVPSAVQCFMVPALPLPWRIRSASATPRRPFSQHKSVVITKHKRVVHASFRFPVWIACLHRSGDQDIPVISSQFIPASFRFPARPGPSTLLGLVSIQSR